MGLNSRFDMKRITCITAAVVLFAMSLSARDHRAELENIQMMDMGIYTADANGVSVRMITYGCSRFSRGEDGSLTWQGGASNMSNIRLWFDANPNYSCAVSQLFVSR